VLLGVVGCVLFLLGYSLCCWAYDPFLGPHTPKSPQNDPADSWLAYTIAKGNGKLVTYVNATWTVPSYPKERFGGNAPGWWFGIEPVPASNLIQPILAYGYAGSIYTIFNGYFQWDNNDWWHSKQGSVEPGNTVSAYVSYVKATNSYDMYISCKETGWSVKSNIVVESGKLYTDVYFVVEHQPDDCAQYPSNGEIVFHDINIAWEGQLQPAKWQAIKYQDACDCTPSILSPSSVKFTWSTQ